MGSASDPVTHRAGDPQNQANHEQNSTDGVQDADAQEIPEQQQNYAEDDHGTHLILTPLKASVLPTTQDGAAAGFGVAAD